MSTTTNFIAELFRAANEVVELSAFEKRGLLDRAYFTIKDMRQQVGVKSGRNLADAADRIWTTRDAVEQRTDDEVRNALLLSAQMIRSLKILLDAKDEVLRGE